MIIKLAKFGTTLISRPNGKEAYLSLQQSLKSLGENENIETDFDGVLTFSPGWGDEVLKPLLNTYGDKLILRNTNNPSVMATLEILQTTIGKKFNVVN